MDGIWRQFFKDVADMRRQQKDYFATKSASMLKLAKETEAKVDAQLSHFKKINYQGINDGNR